MDRRQFLKRCFQIGGYAAIAQLGLGAVEDAIGHGIMPALMGGSEASATTVAWSAWDELSEATFATDNIFVALMENTSAGGNEVGQGGNLSEVNRTLTQAGNIAGATGSPLTRQFDTGKWMTFTDTLAQFLCSATYTIIMKWNTVNDAQGTFFRITEAYNDQIIQFSHTSGAINFAIDAGNAITASTFIATGDVYIVFQADGTHNAMGAWSTTKPTSFGSIAAGQKADVGVTGNISGETAGGGGTQMLGSYLPTGQSEYDITGKLQYIILSNTALLTY